MKWLHECGKFPWADNMLHIPVVLGYLDCVKYAVQNGCLWNPTKMAQFALVAHQTTVFEWIIHETGLTLDAILTDSFKLTLIVMGCREIYEWLIDARKFDTSPYSREEFMIQFDKARAELRRRKPDNVKDWRKLRIIDILESNLNRSRRVALSSQ